MLAVSSIDIIAVTGRHTIPEVTVQKMQNRPKVTVWCGMTATRVIGPYLLRDTMNAERYPQMLEDYVWPIVSGWENIEELVFMHDGAPPLCIERTCLVGSEVSGTLGRRGPHEWPARSPDLTPCDFFLWGWAKRRCTGQNLAQLNSWRTVFGKLSAASHMTSCRRLYSIPGRLRKLVDAAGAYIEF